MLSSASKWRNLDAVETPSRRHNTRLKVLLRCEKGFQNDSLKHSVQAQQGIAYAAED